MSYKLGTRGSPLSLAQTNWVLDELKKTNSSLEFDIEKITTKGDTDTRPLFEMEQKGIFEKEIDRAVSEKRVDFAVHSMKDVPSTLDSSLTIACVPKRVKERSPPPYAVYTANDYSHNHDTQEREAER